MSREKRVLTVAQAQAIYRNGQRARAKRVQRLMIEVFNTINWDESRKLARKHRTKLKHCYANCQIIALKRTDLAYCDGLLYPFVIPHAWLVTASGEVIDPTYCLLHDDSEERLVYVGARYTLQEMCTQIQITHYHEALTDWGAVSLYAWGVLQTAVSLFNQQNDSVARSARFDRKKADRAW